MSERKKLLGFFVYALVVFLFAAAAYFIVSNRLVILSLETLVIGATAFSALLQLIRASQKVKVIKS
jgi:hypothetical protein